MTETETEKSYRVYWNYATKAGKVNRTRAGQCSVIAATSPEAAAAVLEARGRLVAEVREA